RRRERAQRPLVGQLGDRAPATQPAQLLHGGLIDGRHAHHLHSLGILYRVVHQGPRSVTTSPAATSARAPAGTSSSAVAGPGAVDRGQVVWSTSVHGSRVATPIT